MKKSLLNLTLSLFFILLGINSNAQEYYFRGGRTPQDVADIMAKGALKRETFMFDRIKLTLEPGETIKTYNEHKIIKKGDATRLKFIFNSEAITRIVIEGYRESTPQEIQRGVFIATIKPKKTQVIKSTIYYSDNKTETNEQKVIVLKWDDVKEAYTKIGELKDEDSRNKFIEELFQQSLPKKNKK